MTRGIEWCEPTEQTESHGDLTGGVFFWLFYAGGSLVLAFLLAAALTIDGGGLPEFLALGGVTFVGCVLVVALNRQRASEYLLQIERRAWCIK